MRSHFIPFLQRFIKGLMHVNGLKVRKVKVCPQRSGSLPPPTCNTAPEVPETLCQWSSLTFCDFLTSHYVAIRLWE